MKHHTPGWLGIAIALCIVAGIVAGTGASNSAIAAPNSDAERSRIAATLDALHAAAARADGQAYFALFTPDAVFIGTDAAERWSLAAFHAYADPFFAKGQGWVYTPRHREVVIAPIACGCVAWFDELLDSQKYGTSRGTGVLMRTPTGWRIAQYALTFTMPNDLAAELTQRIREHEREQPAK